MRAAVAPWRRRLARWIDRTPDRNDICFGCGHYSGEHGERCALPFRVVQRPPVIRR